jgi:hypothetical protein
VVVRFGEAPPADAFRGLDGVHVLDATGDRVTFEVHDGFDVLVKRLASFTVVDIEAREPTLEEFFFALYARKEREPAAGGESR